MKRLDNTRLVSGSRNSIKTKFTFSEDYEGLEKFVIFTDEFDNSYTVYLGVDGSEFISSLPCGMLHQGSFFSVSVYAGDRLTTNSVVIPVEKSGYVPRRRNGVHGFHEMHEMPMMQNLNCKKDIFVDIYEKLHSCFDTVEFGEDEILFYKNGILDTIVSLPYSHEDEISAWMAEVDIKLENIQEVLNTKTTPEEVVEISGLEIKTSLRQLANRIRS